MRFKVLCGITPARHVIPKIEIFGLENVVDSKYAQNTSTSCD